MKIRPWLLAEDKFGCWDAYEHNGKSWVLRMRVYEHGHFGDSAEMAKTA